MYEVAISSVESPHGQWRQPVTGADLPYTSPEMPIAEPEQGAADPPTYASESPDDMSQAVARFFAEVPKPAEDIPADVIAAFVKAVYDEGPFTHTYELVPGIQLTLGEIGPYDKQLCSSEDSL